MTNKNYKQVSASIRRIADKVLTQDDLAKRIIIQKGNTYRAFDKYTLEETPSGWSVTPDMCDTPKFFNTAKVALAWCILSTTGMYAVAHHLHWIDSRILAKQADIDVLTYALAHDRQIDNQAILLARLSEDINTRQIYKKQLSKIVQTAKYIKQKGTKNELNRFNKTSRRKYRR